MAHPGTVPPGGRFAAIVIPAMSGAAEKLRAASGAMAASGLVRPFQRLLRAVGRDVTEATSSRPCLVLAPHPDDETLGCAVTIMRKLDAGTSVTVAVAGDGPPRGSGRAGEEQAEIRRAELRAACEAMGVPEDAIVLLGLCDGGLASAMDELEMAIARLLAAERPAEVLVTAPWDPHPDHAALGLAARRCLAGREGVELLHYPIWQWRQPSAWLGGLRSTPISFQSRRRPGGGRPLLVRTEDYLDRKREALSRHASQMHPDVEELGMAAGRGTLLDRSFLPRFLWSHEVFFVG